MHICLIEMMLNYEPGLSSLANDVSFIITSSSRFEDWSMRAMFFYCDDYLASVFHNLIISLNKIKRICICIYKFKQICPREQTVPPCFPPTFKFPQYHKYNYTIALIFVKFTIN